MDEDYESEVDEDNEPIEDEEEEESSSEEEEGEEGEDKEEGEDDEELEELRRVSDTKTDFSKVTFGKDDPNVKGLIENVSKKEFETDDYLTLFEVSRLIQYVLPLMANGEYHKEMENICREYKTTDRNFIAFKLIERKIVRPIVYRQVGDEVEKITSDEFLLKEYEYYF
jgi:hypothetical protein